MAAPAAASPSAPTLLEYMGRAGTPADLAVLVAHIQGACKSIAALAASPDLSRAKAPGSGAEAVAAGRDAPKPLDELSVRVPGSAGFSFVSCVSSGVY
jgi:fructose-1,6-bisphosphatase I